MSLPPVRPELLAAALAARLIHDISGPASGITSGLELYADADLPDLRDQALDLATSSSRSLLDLLDFCRLAYGGAGETQDGRTLENLARTPFAGRRCRLVWLIPEQPFNGPSAQALLILLQIAAAGLASGGEARASASVQHDGVVLAVEGEGPRLRFPLEIIDGLAGLPLSEGLPGRWAPAGYLHGLVAAAGGRLTARIEPTAFRLEVSLPP